MFLYHNYDMFLLAVQALDPYTFDKLTDRSYNLNILEIFAIRTNSIMRYSHIENCHRLYYIFLLTHNLSHTILNSDVKTQTKAILQDIAENHNNIMLYSNVTKNYIKRFKISYRKSCGPYLIGHNQYSNDKWITKLSIIHLFLIYKLFERDGVYFLFFYIIYNYRNI
uniref:Uncharacterized protein n=1 Tax=Helminthora furcellata TaxID=1884666 RepID=A0A1G4NZK4_9FLOR|nr:Hypothetical protein ORF_6 [Helminthora furcellata]SCW21238.1 Hypothetical protein ORF_6 [Helminthora furcellata]SCW24098.1 Hypothetical protein ORF_6 [Helminthora furcellata]